MHEKGRPLTFYHPTTIVFLDDNRNFLNAMEFQFSSIFDIKLFTSPNEVLKEINGKVSLTKRHSEYNPQSYHEIITDDNACFEVGQLAKITYDSSRFDVISVLIIDYQMPEINGLDFCQKLTGKNIFKIMLTAEADKDTAIGAFNDGVIDKFILKTSNNLYDEIEAAIHELRNRYFQTSLLGFSSQRYSSIKVLFESELYQKLFQEVFKSSNAVEYYMVDNSGSFIFLDNHANPTWLIVKSADEIQEQFELLQGYDIPASFLTSVAKKEKILCLLSEDEYKLPIKEWPKYLYETKKFDDKYYYCIVKNLPTTILEWNKVISYEMSRAEDRV
jgi:FixJ family two-component response regulator